MNYCHACVTAMTDEAICCPKCGAEQKADHARAQKKNVSVSDAEPAEASNAASGCNQNTLLYRTINQTAVAVIADEQYESYDSVTIPASVKLGDKTYKVTAIGDRAFAYCSSLTSVTFPTGIIVIGDYAFLDCSSLTGVVIPNSVTSIGDRVFYGCSRLNSVTIPNSVTVIGERAFEGCSRLTGVTIPSSVTTIGDHAFPVTTAITRQ